MLSGTLALCRATQWVAPTGFDVGRRCGFDVGRRCGFDVGRRCGFDVGRLAGVAPAELGQGEHVGWRAVFDDLGVDGFADDDIVIATDINDLFDFAFDEGGGTGEDGHTGFGRGGVVCFRHFLRFLGAAAGDGHDGLGIGLQEEVQAEDAAGGNEAVRVAGFLDADRDQAGLVSHLRNPIDHHGVDIGAVFGGEGVEAVGHHFQGVFDLVV